MSLVDMMRQMVQDIDAKEEELQKVTHALILLMRRIEREGFDVYMENEYLHAKSVLEDGDPE